MSRRRGFLAGAVALATGLPSLGARTAAAATLDAHVITGLDASDSIMRHEEWVQLDGILRAVTHPAFLETVRKGRMGRIGFSAFTWAGAGEQRIAVPWTVVASAADIERVAAHLRQVPRYEAHAPSQDGPDDLLPTGAPDRLTDLSGAIAFGHALARNAPAPSARSLLNICGNGTDNVGGGPEGARDAAVAAGLTVNGLVIAGTAETAAYYRRRVIGGDGAFVIEARRPGDVVDAFLRKFLRELEVAALEP